MWHLRIYALELYRKPLDLTVALNKLQDKFV